MDRLHYFIRRLLLVIPTFIGITLVCFALIQVVPGGRQRGDYRPAAKPPPWMAHFPPRPPPHTPTDCA